MLTSFRKIIAGSWLGRVYRVDKMLFTFLLLFFMLSTVSNLIKLQTTPFFIWSMYSMKIPETDMYTYYRINYNNGNVINLRHTWNEPQKTYLYTPLQAYLWDMAHDSVDPFRTYLESHWLKKHARFAGLTTGLYVTAAELDQYPAWLVRYMSSVTGSSVHKVWVLKKQVQFTDTGAPKEVSSDTVLYIP
jgi:hypothetical protein